MINERLFFKTFIISHLDKNLEVSILDKFSTKAESDFYLVEVTSGADTGKIISIRPNQILNVVPRV